MHRSAIRAVLLLTCTGWFVCDLTSRWGWGQRLAAQTPPRPSSPPTNEPTQFLRMRTAEAPNQPKPDPMALDTAVVTYESSAAGEPITVDLIGAVHMGEASYYHELNRLFDGYEVVLYELVAPEGTTVPLGGKRP